MCGFIGRIAAAADPAELSKGLGWIARRGPDAQNIWCSLDTRVSLLHARLAIVDRDPRSDQPFRNAGCTIAFVGEVYNYSALKRALVHHQFKTESDTEVVLALYARYGVDGFKQLNGMFSAALVDERRNKVFLIRDGVGKKPLYFADWNNQLLFGTSIIPMVAVQNHLPGLTDSGIRGYWKNGYVAPSESLLKDTRPVLPGTTLEFDWNGGLVGQHDNTPVSRQIYAGESAHEIRRNITALIDASVKRRLSNNPFPRALLSGGVDSTVVTHTLRKMIPKESADGLQALSLAAWIPGTQDEMYARYAARKMKTPLTMVRLSGRPEDAVVAALELQDEPLGMISFLLLARLVRSAATHGRILITGDGGDEVFYGYRCLSAWDFKNDPAAAAPRDASIDVGPRVPDWFSTWGRETATTVLLGHMLTKVDRASAEQGVEIRCPLLDWDLMAYMRSLPPENLGGVDATKWLLKNQLSNWPRWFVERRKLGFAYNLRWQWLSRGFANLREMVDDQAIHQFEQHLPLKLRRPSAKWSAREIFKHFDLAWKLLVWSQFLARLNTAVNHRDTSHGSGPFIRP